MFQTFSGSSRRPRQVNLSGQNANPFAAVSGTQKTVANAQQERQQRQQERDRLNASKRIQKIWRGHRVREELADARRGKWDMINQTPGNSSQPALALVEQAKLIVAFFNRRRRDDVERILLLSEKLSVDSKIFLDLPEVQPLLWRLTYIVLQVLQRYMHYDLRSRLQY